jgi:alkanesulfonate monooxygenase SsuD/methylene tetrahydromethanopterin reductase-like flavin-dependent oxidoreductase (luciferase family)
MRLSIFLHPQEGMNWATIAGAAERTERGGSHGLNRSDHLAPTSGVMDRAVTEAWSTLAGLARATSRSAWGRSSHR